MARNGLHPSGNQKWVCSVTKAGRSRAYYDSLDGVEYHRGLLLRRRWKALRRIAEREG